MFLFVRKLVPLKSFKTELWENVFVTDLNGGNIKKQQCSPLASDSPRWGWHTSVRMPLAHFITNRITVWSFFSIIHVLSLLPPPLFFRWYYNVTISSTRHAGFLKSTCGHQQCYDGTPQDGSCPATPLTLSDTQVTSCRSHLWKFKRDYFVPRTLFNLMANAYCGYAECYRMNLLNEWYVIDRIIKKGHPSPLSEILEYPFNAPWPWEIGRAVIASDGWFVFFSFLH